jgi:hypothetical protein
MMHTKATSGFRAGHWHGTLGKSPLVNLFGEAKSFHDFDYQEGYRAALNEQFWDAISAGTASRIQRSFPKENQ